MEETLFCSECECEQLFIDRVCSECGYVAPEEES